MEKAKKDIILPPLISNGMVLQREARVKIWGQAASGEELILTFLEKQYRTTTSEDGAWEVVLEGLEPGGPFTMMIACGGSELTLQDIMVGDVWVLGGQSNMQIPVRRTLDLFAEEVKDACCPQIRSFLVPMVYDFHGPQDELSGGSWISVDPVTVYDFSAIGYFFAKKIYEKYKVPIGFLFTAIGGTPAEAWISEQTVRSFKRFDELLDLCKDDSYVQGIIQREEEENGLWYKELYEADEGFQDPSGPWYREDCDCSDWKEMTLPGNFEGTELGEIKGGAIWFRKEITVPASMLKGPGKLLLGTLIDADDTYINGVRIGGTGYLYPPRRYEIPEGLLREGKNTITVRLLVTQNTGAFVTDMPYFLRANGQELPVSGVWKYKIGAVTREQKPTTFFQYKPAGLYNGMIYPLRRYAIRGVLWYQGESNDSHPEGYKDLFEAVIRDWRRLWDMGSFPFLYVQLANYCPWRKEPKVSNWARLREEQRRAMEIPETGMVVTIDKGMYNDLHPWDKKSVGERLALWALRMVFGEDIVCSGPIYDYMEKEGSALRLYFKHVGSGLTIQGDRLDGLEVCGEDEIFYPAEGIIEGDTLLVACDRVQAPCHVRYGWRNNPEEANLYNKEGLPASPFTSIK